MRWFLCGFGAGVVIVYLFTNKQEKKRLFNFKLLSL